MTYSKRIKVYIAGPYSGQDAVTMIRNIRHGLILNQKVRYMGLLTYCPWSDFLEALFMPLFNPGQWKADALDELLRCNALALADLNPRWQDSSGTIDELATCALHDIPVFLESRLWELWRWAKNDATGFYLPGDQEDDGEID